MPAPSPCPGNCNKAWRKAEAELEISGIEHGITPIWGRPVWCDYCTQRFTESVADFPRLAAELLNQALYGTTNATHKAPQKRPVACAWPGQQSRLLSDEIREALTSLEDDVRELRGLTPRTLARREGPAIAASAAFIVTHAAWITVHHPIADDPQDAPPAYLLRLHGRAVRFIGDGKPRIEWKPTPCAGCGNLTLFQQDGGAYVECATCGRLLTHAEYLDRTHVVVVQEERRLIGGSTA